MTDCALTTTCDLCLRPVAVIDSAGTPTAAAAGRVTEAGVDRWRVECHVGRHRKPQVRTWTRANTRSSYQRLIVTRYVVDTTGAEALIVDRRASRFVVPMSEIRAAPKPRPTTAIRVGELGLDLR